MRGSEAPDRWDPRLEGFEPLDFSADIDFRANIVALPKDATMKGMFFTDLVDAVRRMDSDRVNELPTTKNRYIPFSDYPLQDYYRIFERTVAILYPDLPSAEGVRRVAWNVYPRFADSALAKVVVGIFVDDLDRLVPATAKAYRFFARPGGINAVRIGKRNWRYEIRDFRGAMIHYFAGLVEGMFAQHDITPIIMGRGLGPWSFDLSMQW